MMMMDVLLFVFLTTSREEDELLSKAKNLITSAL